MLAPYREGGERRLFSAPEVRAGSPNGSRLSLHLRAMSLSVSHRPVSFPVTEPERDDHGYAPEEPLDPRYLRPRLGQDWPINTGVATEESPTSTGRGVRFGASPSGTGSNVSSGSGGSPPVSGRYPCGPGKGRPETAVVLRWQRYKWGLAVVAALLVIIHATWGGYDEKITPRALLEVVMVL